MWSAWVLWLETHVACVTGQHMAMAHEASPRQGPRTERLADGIVVDAWRRRVVPGQWKRISDGAGPRGAGHGRGAAPTDGRDSSLRPALQVHVGRLRQALRREGRPAVDRQRRRRVRQRALRRVSSRRSSANCSIGIVSARRSRRGWPSSISSKACTTRGVDTPGSITSRREFLSGRTRRAIAQRGQDRRSPSGCHLGIPSVLVHERFSRGSPSTKPGNFKRH